MASQAETQRKAIERYERSPFSDPKVLAEMKRQHQYANTIDPETAKKASILLNTKEK